MSNTLLAQHVALIRDYLTTAVAPAPPSPAPAPTPRPPPGLPPVFIVLAVSPVDLTIATLISPARGLATISTTEPAVLVITNQTIPGCTVNLVGAPVSSVTLTGTPTTAGLYRLVLTYLRNDGSSIVLGSSTHEITVIDPAVLFVAGPNTNYSGRAGVPVNVVLCSPTLALNADVLAFPDVAVPGAVAALVWTAGTTSSGVFSLVGTPTTPGTYTMTVSYRTNVRLLGTSVHTILITSASTPPPPTPAPGPAPPPPVPAPVPSPPPAPAPNPIPGSDPLYASVISLHDFDAASEITQNVAHVSRQCSGDSAEMVFTIGLDGDGLVETGERIVSAEELRPQPYRGSSVTSADFTRTLNVITLLAGALGATNARAYYTKSQIVGYVATVGPNLLSGSLHPASGAAGEAAGFIGGSGPQAGVGIEFDASAGDQTIECYARVNDATGLWAAGSGNRYTPLVSLIDASDALIWTLGLLSTVDGALRTVRLMLWRAARRNPGTAGPNAPIVCYSPANTTSIGAAPDRFVHIAGQWDHPSGEHGCWWGGAGGAAVQTLGAGGTGLTFTTAVLRIGGSCPAPTIPGLTGAPTVLPLHGAVDALRITAASRNTFTAGLTNAISAASRNLPWPNY